MGFTWDRIGEFESKAAADAWCRRQGIAGGESKCFSLDNGRVELSVRRDALDHEDRQHRPQW
jgi:hypothetical protein